MGGSSSFSSAEGSGDLAQPLSAQAQRPRRPSGADKKQKPAKKEGGQGRSRNRVGSLGRSTPNSRHFAVAANQHCQTLEKSESSAKTVDGSLPGPHFPAVLDEKYGRLQCQKMVSSDDLVMGIVILAVMAGLVPGIPVLHHQPRRPPAERSVPAGIGQVRWRPEDVPALARSPDRHPGGRRQ